MHSLTDILDSCRIRPDKKFRWKDFDPTWAGEKRIPKAKRRATAEKLLSDEVQDLAAAQELLYAANRWSVLVILQALDTAGKDGTIKHVMSGVNPQGCQVYSFKVPTSEELSHNYLWRCMKVLPERGHIGIFNRSYYEEVLVVKVHPQLLKNERIPHAKAGAKLWQQRYEEINQFEQHLSRNGTRIVKFFLNISKREQRKRLMARIDDPTKHWKFSAGDLVERANWDDYQAAYAEAISATSTEAAPWYVIPANHKWVARALVATILAKTIDDLKLEYPTVSPEMKQQIKASKKQLEAEPK
ncbi:MAG TPA: polyphosphate kinase 2 family protein [Pirellulales bacterium]|jgi:PPK2 family polyphosphate:nucleotide phosphotransferase|nr:polyphosphate kinase 2 family protein [Pirellulales bacterium]